MKVPSLSFKHQRFIQEYVANGFNAARAYKLVFPKASPESARAASSRLLTSASAKEFLEHETKRFQESIEPTYKRLLNEFAKIAFSDIREVLDFETPGGPYLISGKHLSPEAAACIQSVDVVITTKAVPASKAQAKVKGKTKGKAAAKATTISTSRTRVRLHDKLGALVKLGLHIGMFQELTPLEVFINALPPSLGREVRQSIADATASAKAEPRVRSVGEPDPVPAGDVPGFGPNTRPVAESLPGEHPSPPDRSRVSSGGQEFRHGGEDSPPLFDDP